MADVTLKYKGATIGELSESGNKTIKTAGKYCEADILAEYVKPGGGGGIVLPSTVKIAEITAENNPRNLTIPIPEGHQNHKYYILAIQGSFNRVDWLYITPNHVTGTSDTTGKYIHAAGEKDYELTFVFLQYGASNITGKYSTANNISTSFPITNFFFSAYEAATTFNDGFSVVVYGGD